MQMVDREALAKQLMEFIEAIQNKINAGPPIGVRESISVSPKPWELTIGEKCVGALTDEEHSDLQPILEKMTRACR
jgi:hypothetical protein